MQSKYFYIFLIILSLLVAFYFVRSTFSLYSAKNTLSVAESNLDKLKTDNESLKKEINYRKTDQYVINEAREKLNYGFEGESIIIVPKDNEKSNSATDISAEESSNLPKRDTSLKNISVVKMWLDVFF